MKVQLLLGERELTPAKRRTRLVEYVLLLLGLMALDYVLWVGVDQTWYQGYENWAFTQTLKHKPHSFWLYLEDQFEPVPTDSVKPTERSKEPAIVVDGNESRPTAKKAEPTAPIHQRVSADAIIGRFEVPRLGLNAIVREGVDTDTLRRAVGHVPSTALPGEPGNVAIAAHRDTIFRPIRGIRKDDHVFMETTDGTYEYVVNSMKVVKPTDVSVLQASSPGQELTLITCYPFNFIGAAPNRFIVRARLVKSTEPPKTQSSD